MKTVTEKITVQISSSSASVSVKQFNNELNEVHHHHKVLKIAELENNR